MLLLNTELFNETFANVDKTIKLDEGTEELLLTTTSFSIFKTLYITMIKFSSKVLEEIFRLEILEFPSLLALNLKNLDTEDSEIFESIILMFDVSIK